MAHARGQILSLAQQIGAPDDVAHTAIAHGGQMLADLAREEQQKFQGVDRLALVFGDEVFALRRHADGAGPQMANPLLHAAHGFHDDRPQPHSVGAEEEHLHSVQPRLDAAIGH